MLEKWYEEALNCKKAVKMSSVNNKSVIFKGFKIQHDLESDSLSIVDVRKSEFYSMVEKDDLEIIKLNGFIKGCSLIMMGRDQLRIEKYTKILEKLYETKKNLKDNKKTECEMNINKATRFLFFYKNRFNKNKLEYDEENTGS